jgi:Gluconate 2-dehydrogenase subunit 3
VTAQVFTSSQAALLRLVLNRLVPASGAFPAAGDLGLVEHLDRAAGAIPGSRRLLLEGLRQIEMLGGRWGGFAALHGEEQDAVLREVEKGHPRPFEALLEQTYSAYYSHPMVVQLLGVEGPPQPLGFPLEPFDSGLTENVRRRAPIYRRASP